MAKNRVLVGESLVGDGNEVAHIDLLIGPRGSAAETVSAHALTNNKDGFAYWQADDDRKIQEFNDKATREATQRADAGEPNAAEVVAKNAAAHPFAAA